ncbi:MAG: sensor histidine kinase [Owenweeksia sp.]
MASPKFNITSGVYRCGVWLYLLLWVPVSGYSGTVDSLKTILQNSASSDSLKGFLHLRLGREYYTAQADDSAGTYHFRKCLKLSKSPLHRGRSAFFLQMIFEKDSDSLRYYFNMAEKYQLQTQDTAYLYHLYQNMSLYYQDEGYFQSAAELLLKALKLAESTQDQHKITVTYTSLSVLFHDFEDFEEGKKYGRYALTASRALPDEDWYYYLNALNSMAINLDDNEEYDSALYYHRLAEKLILQKKKTQPLERTLNNMGNTLKKMGLVDSSLTYFLRAYENIKENGGLIIHYRKATVLTNLADVASIQGNRIKAFNYLDSAAVHAHKSRNYEKIRDLYNMKYLVHKRFGNMDSALANLEKHQQLRDSVLDDRNARQVKDLEVAYRTEKKEKENAELYAVTAEQQLALNAARNRNILLGSVAGVFLLVGVFGYRNVKLRQMAEKAAAEEELQKIRFQSVIETEDRERRRIAQDLHDGLGQILATAKLNVASLEGDQKTGEEEELVARSMGLLDQSITELRAISHAMMPEVLRHKGLQPALRELAENINLSLQVQLVLEADEQIFEEDKTRQSSLYRVIQEVINNMLKHSGASEIHLNLKKNTTGIDLKISDNGKGFDTAGIENGKGLGWSNIFSRIRIMNGTVEVRSSYTGTIVHIQVPFEKAS